MSSCYLRTFNSSAWDISMFSSFLWNIPVACLMRIKLRPGEGSSSKSGPSDLSNCVFLHATLPRVSDIPENSPSFESGLHFPPALLGLCCALSAVPPRSPQAEWAVAPRRGLQVATVGCVYQSVPSVPRGRFRGDVGFSQDLSHLSVSSLPPHKGTPT